MIWYYLIFLWFGLMCAFQNQRKKIEIIDGEEVERNTFLFAFIVFVPIIILAVNRGTGSSPIYDMDNYLSEFRYYPSELTNLGEYLKSAGKDKGFKLFVVLIRTFITKDARIYALIIAFIQALCLVSSYRKYSEEYIFSVFLFFASTDAVSWMFNGIRQGMAACIVFVAAPLIFKKKYFKLLLVILLASTFHLTALIMIPLVIIAQNKPWNKKTVLFLVGIILAIIFLGTFTSFLEDALSNTQYNNVIAESTGDNGTNFLRAIVYSVPTIIAFVYRKRIEQNDNNVIDFCINMSIISSGLYILSVFAGGVYFGRLPVYASFFNYILLPWEINHLFYEKSRRSVYIIAILCYLGFYYYQMHITWGFI